jgi:uncharacterized protein
MRVEHLTDPGHFSAAALDYLLGHEAENNLMIGLFEDLARGRREGRGSPTLYVLKEDDGTVVGAALWAGYQLILTRGSPEAHAALANHLADRGTHYPRVCGPSSAAAAFALAHHDRTGGPHAPGPVMRLMETRYIQPPPFPTSGHARFATDEDFDKASQFAGAFVEELNLEAGDRSDRVRRDIAEQNVLFWCDPAPVSMAVVVGRSPRGARIGSVYTPPGFRRRGFGSACVADLGRRLLERGREFVYLYAAVTNKTSNHIYESLGFKPVCDWQEFDMSPLTSFDAPGA